MNTTTADMVNDSTETAKNETLLSPRFYRTDIKALEKMDLSLVHDEWEAMMDEYRNDSNSNHFVRDEKFAEEVKELPPALHKEFKDFLISSVTAEFSGCVLYAEIKKHIQHPQLKELMSYMARDESRHAGFINSALHDYDLKVNLGLLRKEKKYTFFRPKFIFYATYLSEKIGYARYITIFRHLEKHPENRFHPIFRWFERWCNDEFRHGESFALMMKANPKLLRGHNKLWIRFFLLAVFATMYVRDHSREELHKAFGIDTTEYDRKVLHITSEISKQIFPFALDLDNEKFWQRLDRLCALSQQNEAAKQRGGIGAMLTRAKCSVLSAALFARLYMMPTVPNELPDTVRMVPAW